MLRLAEALPLRAALLTTSDAGVLFVSKHAGELSRHFDFNVPDYQTVSQLTNKRLQYECAVKADVPTPLTLFPSELDIQEIGRRVRYPCIIKPCISHLWRLYDQGYTGGRRGKAVEIHSAVQLIRTYREMEASGLELLVQEEIPGGDDRLYSIQAYLDRASEPKALFTKRKLCQYPPRFGDGCFQIGVLDEEVERLGLRLLKSLHYRGSAGVEFKRDSRDGMFKLVEANPRSISQTHNAVVSGVDFPHIAYRDACGEPVEAVTKFVDGIKWVSVGPYFMAYLTYRKTHAMNLAGWVRSWAGTRCFAFFTWDDPLPACAAWWKFVRTTLVGGVLLTRG